MRGRSNWAARPNVITSTQPPPLLADVLGLDREDVAELLYGDFERDADPVVLVALSWDITGDEGSSSPAGGESGVAYLTTHDSQYWTVVSSEGETDVEPVTTTSDKKAMEHFMRGFVDGNDDAVTVYLRRSGRQNAGE